VTKLYESCNKCGIPVINCIWNAVPQVTTTAKIWILSTEREFHRPSNTARLLKLMNPESTELILWERVSIPNKLIEHIDNKNYETYLLFPSDDDDLSKDIVDFNRSVKTPSFIILDGTWKEARKILRKSDCLKKLPRISLNPTHNSEYTLRKGATEGELCTIEAAMEVFKLNYEFDNALLIKKGYHLFLISFKASVNGMKLRE
jgi:DTW domain-containing protein YfiP